MKCVFTVIVLSGLGIILFPFTGSAIVQIKQYQVLELAFTAPGRVGNPFDAYVLRIELSDPEGRRFFFGWVF